MTPREDPANPLLDVSGPARYGSILAAHMEPAIRTAIADAEALRAKLLAEGAVPTWDSLIAPLDDADERVDRAWAAISNLEATLGTDEIRAAHRAVQREVTAYSARAGQDEGLFRAVRTLAEGEGARSLDATQRKILADRIRDFRLAGVDLPSEGKRRARELRTEIAALGSTFADHVTDETRSYRFVVDRREDVEGLPATVVEAARALALRDDPAAPAERWSFTFDQPSALPFLSFQRRRDLRARFHSAMVTRATRGERDNGPVLLRILGLRGELARLLGFANYAELSLAPKMARSPAEVGAFLRNLASRALPRAREEIQELTRIARAEDGLERLERHDVRYYSEKLRARSFGFSQEDLRAYFPLPRVVAGLGKVLGRLYGIDLRDRTADRVLPTWHEEVRVLEVSEGGTVLGHILFDPCARPGKRQGAWVAPSVTRKRRRDGTLQRPVAHLVCNFPPPGAAPERGAPARPSLLSHDEVRTLFHECGHALHHLLSTVDHRAASGFGGVPWDGVEFPSQFHENWIWDPESLALVSGHVETGEPLPEEKLSKMLAARRFLAATETLRHCEYSLIDLALHTTFDPERDAVRDVVAGVRTLTGVVPEPPEERFENSFLHVFHGGYAAGYYGYKWAEVLAADAFGRFVEEGIFAPAAAREFRDTVLSRGGSEDFLALFRRFRGRDPDPSALLRQSGIA